MEKKIDKFETALDSLLSSYSDVPYEDIAEALEFYATRFRKKAEQDESETD